MSYVDCGSASDSIFRRVVISGDDVWCIVYCWALWLIGLPVFSVIWSELLFGNAFMCCLEEVYGRSSQKWCHLTKILTCSDSLNITSS